jgi:exopolyphosphatase/guanosine-5'-triphosphate,3'-diphosphate pyrophosphatase
MYAIIDLGSNTVRMNLYRIKNHQLVLKNSHKETIGLAAYLEDGFLTDEGLNVAISTVKKFLAEIKGDRIKKIYLIATATLRKAGNKEIFFKAFKSVEKLDIYLLSGEEEAIYDFHAVFLDAPEKNGLVVDIGGGSSEIVVYKDNTILHADAIPIGSLSAYMDYVKKLIPSKNARKKIKKSVFKYLKEAGFEPLDEPLMVHGVGGTMRAARKLLSPETDPLKAEALSMTPLKDLIDFIASKEKTAYLKLIRTVPERIHTVGTGLVILDAIKDYFSATHMRIFTQGVREGFMVKQLEKDFPELAPLGLKL